MVLKGGGGGGGRSQTQWWWCLSEGAFECSHHGDEEVPSTRLSVRLSEEFPVHVHPIEVVTNYEVTDPFGELSPQCYSGAVSPNSGGGGGLAGGCCNIGFERELLFTGSQGHQYFQCWILLFQSPQKFEVSWN